MPGLTLPRPGHCRGTSLNNARSCRAREPFAVAWRSRFAALLGLLLPLAGAAGPAWAGGAWSPLAGWPLIAIHAVLMPDGRVLSYGTTQDGIQTGAFIYDIWDPRDGLDGGHLTLPNTTPTDLFCNAQLVLPQSGDILMAGGDVWNGSRTLNRGNSDSVILSAATDQLTPGASMQQARWYGTMTTLANGEIYIQGGKNRANQPSDRAEVRGTDGTFRLLPDMDMSSFYWWYPRNWVAPDGRIFGYANRSMYFVDPRNGGMLSGVGSLPAGSIGINSSGVMYAPGKILVCGGGNLTANTARDATAAAELIDITGPLPRVQATAPMPQALQWHTATVLADGKVAVTGGALQNNQLVGVSSTAYLWDPATGTWTADASTLSGRARLYHSTALLLPDASVLVAGGGAPGPQTNTNAEIYYPPYLFTATGELAARPAIVQAPSELRPGTSIAVQVDNGAAIRRVTLIKTGSVTHSFNMDQRFQDLAFTASGNVLQVQLPQQPAQVPPGPYLLFVINDQGVPSVAALADMRIADNPVSAVDYSPAVGESLNGQPATTACATGQALVGVYGQTTATGFGRIGPRCVAVNASGRWLSNLVNGRVVGTGTGAAFSLTCPRNTVVTEMRATSSGAPTQVALGCAALTTAGRAAGPAGYPPAIGTAAGRAFGPLACSSGNAAYALYGRVSTSIRSLGLLCRSTAPVIQSASRKR